MNKQKGFTIIELIVVIAIIAVLAAIVLVNVTQYINKGKDASAQGNLSTLMTNGAVWFDTPSSNGLYTGFNTSASWNSVSAAMTSAGYALNQTLNAVAWCASTNMKAQVNSFCVDSTGNKKMGSICAGQVCP